MFNDENCTSHTKKEPPDTSRVWTQIPWKTSCSDLRGWYHPEIYFYLLYYCTIILYLWMWTPQPFCHLYILEANQLKCELNRPSDTSPRHWLRFVMPYFDGISYPFLLKFLQFLLGVSKDSWNFNQRFLSMPPITLSKISGAHRRFLF